MAAEISAVEEPPPTRLDEERVCVEGAVVDEEGCDLEWAEFERLPVGE